MIWRRRYTHTTSAPGRGRSTQPPSPIFVCGCGWVRSFAVKSFLHGSRAPTPATDNSARSGPLARFLVLADLAPAHLQRKCWAAFHLLLRTISCFGAHHFMFWCAPKLSAVRTKGLEGTNSTTDRRGFPRPPFSNSNSNSNSNSHSRSNGEAAALAVAVRDCEMV